jgi:flavin reductase (DIM6/NTAB) family NADH-FMN oxidoreductase RutF
VSYEPLLVALSINPSHASYPLLMESGAFVVNVLQEGQLDLARRFGTQSGRDVDKIAGTRWRAGQFGAPVLSEAAAFLECHVTGTLPAGDHVIIVAEAVDGAVLDADAKPLRYDATNEIDGSAGLFPDAF